MRPVDNHDMATFVVFATVDVVIPYSSPIVVNLAGCTVVLVIVRLLLLKITLIVAAVLLIKLTSDTAVLTASIVALIIESIDDGR